MSVHLNVHASTPKLVIETHITANDFKNVRIHVQVFNFTKQCVYIARLLRINVFNSQKRSFEWLK